MYDFPGRNTNGRTYHADHAGVRLVYPLVDLSAPPEVEHHAPGAVRMRVVVDAPDRYGYLGEVIEKNAGRRQIENLKTFDVFFTFPRAILRDPSWKCAHLVVMLNGLNENRTWSSDLYDLVAASLAERGIASVLLPTPFHLNRTPQKLDLTQDQIDKLQRQRQLGLEQPVVDNLDLPTDCDRAYAPYFNFAQTFDEIDAIVAMVHGRTTANPANDVLFRSMFDQDTEISLFGYSLGGLRVLAKFLLHEDSRVFRRSILLCSGSTLTVLSPPRLPAHQKEQWTGLIRSAKSAASVFEKISKRGLPSKLFDGIFALFFDHEISDNNLLREAIRERSHGVLMILGSKDEQVREEATKRLRGQFVVIDGMEHRVIDDQFFLWYYPLIVNSISGFIEARRQPPPPYPSDRQILAQALGQVLGQPPVSGRDLWQAVQRLPAGERDQAVEIILRFFAYHHGADEVADAVNRAWPRNGTS